MRARTGSPCRTGVAVLDGADVRELVRLVARFSNHTVDRVRARTGSACLMELMWVSSRGWWPGCPMVWPTRPSPFPLSCPSSSSLLAPAVACAERLGFTGEHMSACTACITIKPVA